MNWFWNRWRIGRKKLEEKNTELRGKVERLREQRDRARMQRDRLRKRPAIGDPEGTGALAESELHRQLKKALAELSDVRVQHQSVVADLEIAETKPLPSELKWPLPPSDLRWRISGSRSGWAFLTVGENVARDLAVLAAAAGRDLGEFRSVLDFGCGCGRVLRHLPEVFPRARIHGADVDAEAVGWCREHLPFLGDAYALPELPPVTLPDAAFDFILAISVFTHLPLAVERAWLAELRRISKPGALLILSFMPDTSAREHFSPDQAAESEDGFSFFRTMPVAGLPDYYHVSYHTDDAIRRLVGEWFEIVDLGPKWINAHQSAVVCVCPPDPGGHP